MTHVDPRTAEIDDVEGVVATLTSAFLADPVLSWVFPDPDVRPARLATLWGHVAGGVYVPMGASATLPGHDAVALWQPPGAPGGAEYWEEHGERFVADLDGDAERMAQMSALVGDHHPDDREHWYLLAIGTRDGAQGRGLGSVLLAHTLAVADEHGAPAYLEATSARSRVLYQRFGFEVIDEFAPDGCPPLYGMWREPLR